MYFQILIIAVRSLSLIIINEIIRRKRIWIDQTLRKSHDDINRTLLNCNRAKQKGFQSIGIPRDADGEVDQIRGAERSLSKS